MVSPSGIASGAISYCAYNSGFNEAIVLALLILTFIAAMVYMAAQFARRPEWEAWVKIQLYHIGISTLLAAGAIMFAGLACGVSLWVAGGAPFTIADQHISDLFTNNMKVAITQLIKVQVVSEYLAAVFVQIGGATFGMGFAPFPVYKIISNNAQLLTSLALPFASSLLAQQMGLQIIHASAFTVLLPMGIVLRAFGITREAGSFMIATAIGLFIVLPLTYVMDKMIMEGPTLAAGVQPPAQPSECIGATRGYDRAADHLWWQNVYSENSRYKSLISFLDRIPFRPDTLIAPAMQCLAYVIPQAVFLPALNMIITIAFISSLTKFLSRNLGG
ncbi:Uncharacterised protein [Candidatus Burarchaeum australiense]|nr:Uncharacterised protein [Candidatus Burarchaeum australiense]